MPVQLNIKRPVLPIQSLSGEELERELAERDAFMKDLEQFHLERGLVKRIFISIYTKIRIFII